MFGRWNPRQFPIDKAPFWLHIQLKTGGGPLKPLPNGGPSVSRRSTSCNCGFESKYVKIECWVYQMYQATEPSLAVHLYSLWHIFIARPIGLAKIHRTFSACGKSTCHVSPAPMHNCTVWNELRSIQIHNWFLRPKVISRHDLRQLWDILIHFSETVPWDAVRKTKFKERFFHKLKWTVFW